MNSTTSRIQVIQTIKAMQNQEQHYAATDYLSTFPSIDHDKNNTNDDVDESSVFLSTDDINNTAKVDEECRMLMAQWCRDVAGTCNYQQETVAIALNILDRFMATSTDILFDRNQFQLASMTSLYISAKIHEHECMDSNLISALSRGGHTKQDVENMESNILRTLQWRVNPPTASSFIRLTGDLMLLSNITSSISTSTISGVALDPYELQVIMDIAQQQIHMVMIEYTFGCCCHKESEIAFAALLNAIVSCLGNDHDVFHHVQNIILKDILAVNKVCIEDLRIRMNKRMNINNNSYNRVADNDEDVAATTITAATTTALEKQESYTEDNNTTAKYEANDTHNKHSSPRTVIPSATNF